MLKAGSWCIAQDPPGPGRHSWSIYGADGRLMCQCEDSAMVAALFLAGVRRQERGADEAAGQKERGA